jgi:hypothetical protein
VWWEAAGPVGMPLQQLITQRSRVQIPPPPPLPSRAFVLHLLRGCVALPAVSGGPGTTVPGPFCVLGKDEVGNGRGRVLVHGVLLAPVGDVLGMQGTAVRPGEHVAVVAVASSDRLTVPGLEVALGL